MKTTNSKKAGFTIIEVVLVLAIAGLIFLMVFIALPALNKQQRDTVRRNDAAIFGAAVREYMTNNHGNPPPDGGSSIKDIDWEDPNDPRAGQTWTTPDKSNALDRYLIGIDSSGVTTRYYIHNYYEQHKQGYYFPSGYIEVMISDSKGNEGYYDGISAYIGALCPEETAVKRNGTVKFKATYKKSDIAIFRMLESGFYYCLQV